MKRICHMLLAAALLAAGCTKEDNGGPIDELVIGISSSESKVTLGSENAGQFSLLWSEGDEVAVTGDAGQSVFRLKSGAGSTRGTFEYKSGARGHKVITDVIFPATNAGNVPATQNYTTGTFDPSAMTLTYHNPSGTKEHSVMLECKSSVLCFQMKGIDKLSSIAVSFKNGKTYTLNTLNAPVLDKSKAAPFYIVVPSQKSDRVDVTFTSASGSMNRSLLSKEFMSGYVHRFAQLEFKADKKYRIMSYNIGQCSQGGNSSAKLIADVTKELKVDVAVMNEVRSSLIFNHAETIAENLGWEKYYKSAISGMGNMITYNPNKLKLIGNPAYLELKKIEPSDTQYNEDRVCLFMEFENFILLGSHIQKDAFVTHTKLITDKVKAEYAKKGKPVIFCGDMNTRPYAVELKDFTSEWRVLSRTDQSTFYNPDQPDNLICIDYIFLWKGGPDVWVTEAKVCKQVSCCTITDASDHFPIYVDITVGNSSLPLLEEEVSLGTFSIDHEPIW